MEPSMIMLCDMVSFSDAHEEKEIPVIAANVHRMIPPGQSQIWAVLRASDTGKRIVYSMANTFLGVMCLSGDVYALSDSQWELVDRGIAFYRAVNHIIRDGHTCFLWNGTAELAAPGGLAGNCPVFRRRTGSVMYRSQI